MAIENIEKIKNDEIARAKQQLEISQNLLKIFKESHTGSDENIKQLELHVRFYEKLVWKLERLDPTI